VKTLGLIVIALMTGCSCAESRTGADAEAGEDGPAAGDAAGIDAGEAAFVCRDAGAGETPLCSCVDPPGASGTCQSFVPGDLPRPWWLDSPPEACLESPHHEPIQAYDDCEIGPGDTAGTPPECCTPRKDTAYCNGRFWTETCLTDSDCPEDMVCVDEGNYITYTGPVQYRTCQKRCNGSGGAECIRCDFSCNAAGYCEYRPPDRRGPPCEADCECSGLDPMGQLYNTCRSDGYCYATGADGRFGVCDESQRGPFDDFCACGAGTCEPTPGGGCCRAADGHIARNSRDEVCVAADAGTP
jgi:hypothetical protein